MRFISIFPIVMTTIMSLGFTKVSLTLLFSKLKITFLSQTIC